MNGRLSRHAMGICALVSLVVTLTAGCVDQSVRSPAGTKARQTASAGYTGCPPEENVISNFNWGASPQTWNVSCKGKMYLCTALYQGGELTPKSMSCAPVAQ